LWEDGAITDLGTLEAAGSSAGAINNRGQIVGWSWDPDRAFLWEDGTMSDVLGPDGGQFTDINDRGQIVGWSRTSSGKAHAVLWKDGMMTGLGTLGGFSVAERINDGGQIVGRSVTSSGEQHAVLWTVTTPGK